MIVHYHPVIEEHIEKVHDSQKREKRLQVYYLSSDSQNEFIDLCANEVRQRVLQKVAYAKYYAIMVDATPDVAHVEQTSFVLRYLVKPGIIECGDSSNEYEIKERFLRFVSTIVIRLCSTICGRNCIIVQSFNNHVGNLQR